MWDWLPLGSYTLFKWTIYFFTSFVSYLVISFQTYQKKGKMRACYISIIKNIHTSGILICIHIIIRNIFPIRSFIRWCLLIQLWILFTLNCIMSHALLVSFNNYSLKYDLFFDNDVTKILVQVSKKIFSMNVPRNKVKP